MGIYAVNIFKVKTAESSFIICRIYIKQPWFSAKNNKIKFFASFLLTKCVFYIIISIAKIRS